MKVLFLYANGYNFQGVPIGLSYLISILKQRQHQVSLFDTTFVDFDYSEFNISGKIDQKGKELIENFRKQVAKTNPDLIGISCISLCLNFAIEMIESLRNRPMTTFGGVGPTVDYENLIKHKIVDYICVGFGEECLPSLIDNIENKESLDDIPNLVYKPDKGTKTNTFFQKIDLERLPLPDWSLFDRRHFLRPFKNQIKRWGNFQLTRGCPFNCAYCINAFYHQELGMKIQKIPPEKIIQEIKILAKKYNLEIIRMFDECFGLGKISYYRQFGKLYKQTVNLPSIIETRPEAVTPELVEILKTINCISVSIGIEVGNENQRRDMLNRDVSNQIIRNAFELLHKARIRTSSYNIIGFPHDTRELISETIKLNRECRPDFVNCFLLSPFPKPD